MFPGAVQENGRATQGVFPDLQLSGEIQGHGCRNIPTPWRCIIR